MAQFFGGQIKLKYNWQVTEKKNDVKKFIEAQHDAERRAWQLEDQYQILHGGLNEQFIEAEMNKEVTDLLRDRNSVSAFDLRWNLLLRPERAEQFIEKMIDEGVIDASTKRPSDRGGWEYQLNLNQA